MARPVKIEVSVNETKEILVDGYFVTHRPSAIRGCRSVTLVFQKFEDCKEYCEELERDHMCYSFHTRSQIELSSLGTQFAKKPKPKHL